MMNTKKKLMNKRHGPLTLTMITVVMTLSACSLRPERQPPKPVHDWGPLPTAPATSDTHAVIVVQANTPAWLNSSAIFYREQFADPTELHPYANARWAASPAELFEERLKSAIAINGSRLSAFSGRDMHYRLVITLESFEQVFQTPRQARADLRLRALLLEPTTRRVIDQHLLTMTKPCSADMNGAVTGLSQLANAGIDELINWLAVLPAEQIKPIPTLTSTSS